MKEMIGQITNLISKSSDCQFVIGELAYFMYCSAVDDKTELKEYGELPAEIKRAWNTVGIGLTLIQQLPPVLKNLYELEDAIKQLN